VSICRIARQQGTEYTEALVNNTEDNFVGGTGNSIDLLLDAASKPGRYAFRRVRGCL
jgi:hypothetical protein